MLIGLAGGIGAGKDTAFERIKVLFPDHEVVQVSFAAKLKESASALFGLTSHFVETEKRNPKCTITLVNDEHDAGITLTFRQFLQRYGTEAHRDVFGDNFWVDAALPLDFDHTGKIVCVTDARFGNELQRIIDLDGVNILLDAEQEEASTTEAAHASETSVDMSLIGHTIDNRTRGDGFASLDRQLHEALEGNLQKVGAEWL